VVVKITGLDHQERAIRSINVLRDATKDMIEPATCSLIARYGRDPFIILVACLLSLRTKDTVSLPASLRLFEQVRTPHNMLTIPISDIAKIIYPVGFYRRKAANLHAMCTKLITEFGGTVPSTEAELLTLPGVGRKTANLVLAEGFGMPALCVDVHVHRISNRLGLVTTTTPEQTEHMLRLLLPSDYWNKYSRLLVTWGQNVCVPILPFCARCPLASLCPKVGVIRSR
jgi:endonuclease-3